MPQQINLCMPVLMVERHYVSARTMGQMLMLLLVVGGALAAYGAWSWNGAARGLRAVQAAREPELASLRAALARHGVLAAGDAEALNRQLDERRLRLEARRRVLAELQRGLHAPGQGHAARLRLVASSIPAQAWVTDVEADTAGLELRGYTLEPASLNDWIARLGQSPLLEAQRLGTVRVERVDAAARRDGMRLNGATVPPASSIGDPPPAWAFTLSTAVPGQGSAVGGTQRRGSPP